MNSNVIITCAITGAGDTTQKNKQVPVTPKEIADSAIEAAKAGAAIAHIHVRDPKTAELSHDPALFREVVERVRESDTDIILNLTAGGGGDWVPAENDPTRGGDGTDIQTPKERHEPVEELQPEISTLDCGSYNFSDNIYINPTPWLREQAKMIQDSGVKAELECFDLGHIRFARQLADEGLLIGDPMFQICLGIPWAAEADMETMLTMRNHLPKNAHWTAFGIGRMQIPIAMQSVLMGGHVRVGLEDNLYLKKGVLASNGQLVEKAATMVESLGAKTMTSQEARETLGLQNPKEVRNKHE